MDQEAQKIAFRKLLSEKVIDRDKITKTFGHIIQIDKRLFVRVIHGAEKTGWLTLVYLHRRFTPSWRKGDDSGPKNPRALTWKQILDTRFNFGSHTRMDTLQVWARI